VSSRIRPPRGETDYGYEPEYEDYDEWDAPSRGRRGGRPPRRRARTFAAPVVAGAAVLGLLIGWVAHSGGGGTTTVTQTKTVTAPAPTAAATPASRPDTVLAVLNGSGEAGLAARTAETARGLGYTQVTEGNAPELVASDQVLYRAGAAAKARQVAQDLDLPSPTRLTSSDPLSVDPAAADVYVVLGPTAGAAAPSDGTSTAPDAGAGTGTDTGSGSGTDSGSGDVPIT
jgi:hypothetical protein